MQDIGLWTGGALVLYLANKDRTILNARKSVIVIAYACMMAILVVPFIESINLNVVLLGIYVFGIGAFLGNQHAFKQDVVRASVATVAALVGFIETGFTAYVIREVGWVTRETADFTPVFFVLAGLATFALLVTFILLRPRWVDIQ
jgi:hypothetical protein